MTEEKTPEKKPTPKKPEKKVTRRTKAELEKLAEKVDALMASGTPKTVACEKVGIGIQSYNNVFKRRGDTSKATESVDQLTKAVDDFKQAADRLRALGASFTVSKIKFNIEV